MSYAGASSVAALCKNLLGGRPGFSTSTCPTINEVNSWLSSGCAIIESTLAGCKYTVPVANGTTAYDWLAQLNALYGAAYAELSRTNVTLAPGERTRGQVYLEQFEMGLGKLCNGDFTLAGLSRTTSGKLYTGGISIGTKQTYESNSDRVGPKFFKGLGRFDETIEPGSTTASQG